jgi:hypothetical protein
MDDDYEEMEEGPCCDVCGFICHWCDSCGDWHCVNEDCIRDSYSKEKLGRLYSEEEKAQNYGKEVD